MPDEQKVKVRKWLTKRAEKHDKQVPSLDEIRRRLGWKLKPEKPKR